MNIKKFKNGKIKMTIEKEYDILENGSINENVYHDDMFMNDLSINQINGYQYIIDENTSTVYPLVSNGYYLACYNPLTFILKTLQENGKIYLYPCSKKESESLLQDLENGF